MAKAHPPGDFLREELRERRWTQKHLASIMGRPTQVINEIINNKKEITPATAKQLAAALGTSAKFWLNLQNTYRLSLLDKRLARNQAMET